jgi:hypothetical protein
MAKTKNKVKQHENPLERLFDLDDLLGLSTHQEQPRNAQEKVMIEGQEVILSKSQEEKARAQEEEREEPQIEAGIDYLKNYSREISQVAERAVNRENQELEMQLREIMAEIKKLADSSKELQAQFKSVAVEQYVVTPGKYHKNFFSWLLSMIRSARARVEDSGAWLAAMHSKKKSREYGAMAKKQGTSFTLNNERTVATQVG